MDIEPLIVVASLVIGTIVGMGYFAGLWITVQILPEAKRPVLTWAGSALLRVSGATVVFLILLRWGLASGEGFDAYAPAAAGLAGFVIARFASTAIWGQTREPKIPKGPARSGGEINSEKQTPAPDAEQNQEADQ